MKSLIGRFQTFMRGKRLQVRYFEERLNKLPAGKRQQMLKTAFLLYFVYEKKQQKPVREFFHRFFVHDREVLLMLIMEHTPWGRFRYRIHDTHRFIRIIHLLVKNDAHEKQSWYHLAFVLQLAFDLPWTYRTLTSLLRDPKVEASDLWQLYEEARLS